MIGDENASTGSECDIFLYNDRNEKGGKNGLACICLSLVDGKVW